MGNCIFFEFFWLKICIIQKFIVILHRETKNDTTMSKLYSIKISLWTESNYGGNMSVYYFGGFRKNGTPKFVGTDLKKVWKMRMYAEYYQMKLREFLSGELWVGSYNVEIIEK